MLRLLSSGPDVADLQSRLNSAPPTTQAPLAVDGIFGPKTRARVVEFQERKGLVADGIVGPKTWAALLAIPELIYPPRSGIDCGAGDPDNQPLVAQVAMEFGQDLVAVGLVPAGAAFNPFESGGMSLPSAPSLPSLPALPKFRKLSPGEEATARSVFGSSLDYGSVFITNKAGAKNRPFTVAIPLPAIVAASFGVGGIVQVLLLGAHAAAPSRDLLIHELTHVWHNRSTLRTRGRSSPIRSLARPWRSPPTSPKSRRLLATSTSPRPTPFARTRASPNRSPSPPTRTFAVSRSTPMPPNKSQTKSNKTSPPLSPTSRASRQGRSTRTTIDRSTTTPTSRMCALRQ
jgi:hypothetical protein